MDISDMDIKKLLHEPSGSVRAELAGKIARGYAEGGFSERESIIANEIFRLLARDAEIKVRQALADNLKQSLVFPKEIALQLAKDVVEVAVPMLECSYALSEEDLIDIVRSTQEVAKLSAIARRASISWELADVLMENGGDEVIATLFSNKGAIIAESSLLRFWEKIAARESLLEALVYRGGLSLNFAEKLFAVVSDELKLFLIREYRLPHHIVEEAVADARETAMLEMISDHFSEKDIGKLVDQLHQSKRLTYSLIIRALCAGDLEFFETAMAKLAGLPLLNAKLLMLDAGPLGFEALYKATPMPEGFFDAIRTILRIALEETDYGRFRREDYRRRVTDRLMAEGCHRTVDHMPYLMAIIGGNVDAAATIN